MGPGGATTIGSSLAGGTGATVSTAAGGVATKADGDQKSYKKSCCLGPGGATTIGSSLAGGKGAIVSTAAGIEVTEAAGG